MLQNKFEQPLDVENEVDSLELSQEDKKTLFYVCANTIGILEGYRCHINHIHWTTTSANIHTVSGDLLWSLNNFVDGIAEMTIALCGRENAYPIIPEPSETDFNSLSELVDCVIADIMEYRNQMKIFTELFNSKIDEMLDSLHTIKYKSDII